MGTSRSSADCLTRRQFLRRAARAGVGLGAAALLPGRVLAGGATSRPALATVVRVRSRRVTDGRVIRVDILQQMIEQGLMRLTGRGRVADAWRAVVGDAEKLLLKFRADAADVLQTSPEMASALAASLTGSGFAAESLIACELEASVAERLSLGAAPHGHRTALCDYGSGKDHLNRFLFAADAIVNVPFLTDDRICGLACAIKNVAYSAVRHPSRMHASRCDPQLADIYALPEVGGKVGLHVCNAVRAICAGGPGGGAEWLYRGLFLATDPVALDVVALEALELERRRRTVSASSPAEAMASVRPRAGYLETAARKGVGVGSLDHINVVDVTL